MEEFVLHHLQDFDVICLQECIGLLWETKDRFLAACKRAGFFYIADPKPPGFFSTQHVCEGGVLILSRFEITEQEFLPFSYAVDGEGQSVLGTIYAKVKIPASIDPLTNKPVGEFRYLRIFNVHT